MTNREVGIPIVIQSVYSTSSHTDFLYSALSHPAQPTPPPSGNTVYYYLHTHPYISTVHTAPTYREPRAKRKQEHERPKRANRNSLPRCMDTAKVWLDLGKWLYDGHAYSAICSSPPNNTNTTVKYKNTNNEKSSTVVLAEDRFNLCFQRSNDFSPESSLIFLKTPSICHIRYDLFRSSCFTSAEQNGTYYSDTKSLGGRNLILPIAYLI